MHHLHTHGQHFIIPPSSVRYGKMCHLHAQQQHFTLSAPPAGITLRNKKEDFHHPHTHCGKSSPHQHQLQHKGKFIIYTNGGNTHRINVTCNVREDSSANTVPTSIVSALPGTQGKVHHLHTHMATPHLITITCQCYR